MSRMAVFNESPSVLVVYDHIDTCRALVRLLTMSGHPAQCIESGHEALEFLKTCEPCLVFLDMMMPDVSGLEVLKAIRANEKCKSVIVVMYSAWSDPDMIRKAMDHGADRYIVKGSLDFRTLEQIVRQYLGQLN